LAGAIDMAIDVDHVGPRNFQETLEVDALQREVRDLRKRLDGAEKARQELLSSTSWRMTRPIRALKTRLQADTEKNRVEATDQDVSPLVPGQIARVSDSMKGASGNEICSRVDVRSAFASLRKMPGPVRGTSRIVFLGSRELACELEFDAEVDILRESNWRDCIRPAGFDYLLIETVWVAACEDWRYAMTSENGSRTELLDLLDECRRISLPVVLWFREDVRNYERFSWLVPCVDRVYAVDDSVRDSIRHDHPDIQVSVLPPAIQPATHNPVCSYALQEAREALRGHILFDGWWDASADGALRHLLESIASRGLRLCESEWEFGSVRLNDAPTLAAITLGCVDGPSKAVLNKLIDSELFFQRTFRLPWRQRLAMIRAAAAGGAIGFIGDAAHCDIAWHGASTQIGEWLSELQRNPLARVAASHRLRRRLLAGDCLSHRLAQIGRDLGLAPQPFERPPAVAMVLVTMRPQLLEACLQRFRQDRYPNKELIVVLHGDHDVSAARSLVGPDEPIRVIQLGSERSLGACLNQAIEESEAEYWAKVDDDDLYGPEYLSDVMASRLVSSFQIAGKPPVFAYLEADDSLYHDPEWASLSHVWHASEEACAALVAGGTLVGRRDLLERGLRFSEKRRGGSDSDFIRRCYEQGHGVLALDGFNFVRYRSGQAGFHTWQMDERELRGRAARLGGLADVPDRVFV